MKSSTPTAAPQMRFLCSDSDSDKGKKSDLKLAKPGGAKSKRNIQSTEKNNSTATASQPSKDEVGVSKKLIEAVDSVVKSIRHHPEAARSELLQKLQEHTVTPGGEKSVGSSKVSSLFAGMKVEASEVSSKSNSYRPTARVKTYRRVQVESLGRDERLEGGARRRSLDNDRDQVKGGRQTERPEWREKDGDTRKRVGHVQRGVADIRLFDGPALGIFTKNQPKAEDSNLATTESPRTSMYDTLEQEEKEKLLLMPPKNAFEEMIRWTKEGKLWTFPIDNDQGLTEEAKVGFHEHIFLEHLLDKFPQKGPVRHFMELVVVGLSKNPCYTVEEKKAHIDWFAEYFKDKYHFLDDVISSEQEAAQQSKS
jgi:small subunit ribosomal protein S31